MKDRRAKFIPVSEALEFLKDKGVVWSEVWLRRQIASGTIKSKKEYSLRLVPVSELERVVKQKRSVA